MQISRTGIIVNVEKYAECFDFYRHVLGLPILFQKSELNFELCCFEFLDSYLMLESGGVADVQGKSVKKSPIKIRFNVDDINQASKHLQQKGINHVVEWYDWGANINIFDPDGNRIGIRDEQKFKQEIINA